MTTSNFKFFISLLAVVFIFALSAFAETSELGSRHWKLTHLNGKAVGETKAYIEIDPAASRFNGNTGCNLMFGTIKIAGRSMTFSRIGTTKMACNVATGTLEGSVVKALNQATRYKVDGNDLNIYAGNRRIMKFKAEAQSSGNVSGSKIKLEDRKWFLDSVGSTPVGALGEKAFINFDHVKGSAGGDTSCNVFGGNYTVKGDSLRIKDVISTMRACIEDDRMNIERAFLNGLTDADRFEIIGEKLYLYHGTKLLLSFNGKNK